MEEKLTPDIPKEIKEEKPKKVKEEKPKDEKTIRVSRMGQETKCSKENLQSFLDAGWKEV